MWGGWLVATGWWLVMSLICVAAVLSAQSEPDGAGLERGTLPDRWATGGPDCATLPKWEAHQYNGGFWILRQSGCVHYEKPFLFLFIGAERALLLDTGAGVPGTAAQVTELMQRYPSKRLVVAHTHGHGDHTAGDRELAALPDVTMIPAEMNGLKQAFKISNWPDDTGSIDLGNRVIDVIPIPGHDATSLAFYDARTGILLTGDTLYPGRLYIQDFPAFLASVQRLVRFTAGKPVAHILGNHIEQTRTPYLDYKAGTKYQPEEHELALSRAHLLELAAALETMKAHPVRQASRDFTIWPK